VEIALGPGEDLMSLAFLPPDLRVLERRDFILQGLAQLVAPEALITSEDERRAFETDALTAYRKIPLAVVLPSTTQEVCAVLRFCRDNNVKVVARGAGTSLAGGAIPQEDAIVVGVSKLNSILSTDFMSRRA
jgi:glycolate oxidase